MAKFDVYANPGGTGYLLDVQADILIGLNTRIVVPLIPLSQAPLPAKRLNPVFDIGSEPHAMAMQFMAAIPRAVLRSPITNLAERESEVMAALDMALVGF